MPETDVFAPWLALWQLAPDGAPTRTPGSHLLPVLQHGEPAMLKLPDGDHERLGYLPLDYWAGDGAARLLARNDDGSAMLIERATGTRSLSAMARSGAAGDDKATVILCDAIAALQKARGPAPSGLIPLDVWFEDLFPMAQEHGGILARSAAAARGSCRRSARSCLCMPTCTTTTCSISGRAAGSPSTRNA